MVKHVILWTLKDSLSPEEKAAVKNGIKEGLEGLAGRIPGLMEIKVYTEGALKGYAVHPEHVAVADGKVRPYTASRVCMDFEV